MSSMEITHPKTLSSQPPTFSSENLADIAARVVSELNLHHSDPFHDDFYSSLSSNHPFQPSNPLNDELNDEGEVDENEEDESEFEFAVDCGEEISSPISADEIFYNGQIRPIYPLFNTHLVYQNDAVAVARSDSPPDPPTATRAPLRKLITEERESRTTSCSSSEADELERVPPETYCVWGPKKEDSQNDDVVTRKKSNSTGSSSKRWRIRDLLYRSNSDGKDTFVFLTPSSHQSAGGDSKRSEKVTAAKKVGGGGLEEKKKRKKTYLPYRQDLVGIFANVNGISRTVRPF